MRSGNQATRNPIGCAGHAVTSLVLAPSCPHTFNRTHKYLMASHMALMLDDRDLVKTYLHTKMVSSPETSGVTRLRHPINHWQAVLQPVHSRRSNLIAIGGVASAEACNPKR
jgi:hypothetical protein